MKKPTETIYQAAIARRANGKSLDEIIDYFARNFNTAIPRTTLHRKCKIALNGTEFGTVEQEFGTCGTTLGTLEKAAIETQAQTAENRNTETVERSEQMEQRSKRTFFTRHFSRMDAVFYIATAAACYSFWYAVPGVPGATFAALYWLLAFDALQRVKAAGENEALAKLAEVRVWGCEVWASVAHWNIINEYLWQNLDKLPFEVKAVPQGGTWVLDYTGEKTNVMWQNGDFVGLIAAVLSCSICAAVIVAVGATFQASKQAGK